MTFPFATERSRQMESRKRFYGRPSGAPSIYRRAVSLPRPLKNGGARTSKSCSSTYQRRPRFQLQYGAILTDKAKATQTAYKCQNLAPWYSVPDVQTPEFFLTYMSGRAASLVRNDAHCTCINSIHAVRFRHAEAASALNAVWNSDSLRLGYELKGHPLGGGMLKLEPGGSSPNHGPIPFHDSAVASNGRARGRQHHAAVEALCRHGVRRPTPRLANGTARRRRSGALPPIAAARRAKHIKPLHWYIACRLVLEGGFNPDHITPRPPFLSRRNAGKDKRVFGWCSRMIQPQQARKSR